MSGNGLLETLCYRITEHCNLGCQHCRAGSSPATREYGHVDTFLAFARDAQRTLGLRHVSVSGGEPALHPDLRALVASLAAMGLHVSVTTNGTFSIARILEPVLVRSPELVRVRVSIDGTEHIHDAIRGAGTHPRALREIREIGATAGWVGMNTVAFPELLAEATAMASMAKECGVSEWALITPVPQGAALGRPWFAERLAPVARELKSAAQDAGYGGRIVVWDFLSTPGTSVLVRANGDMVLSGVDGHEPRVARIGNCDMHHVANELARIARRGSRSHFAWSGWT